VSSAEGGKERDERNRNTLQNSIRAFVLFLVTIAVSITAVATRH
jgi:hypothetical protein